MSRRNSGHVRRRPLATRCRGCRDRPLHLGNAEIRAPRSGHRHAAAGARRRDRTWAKGRCGVTDGKIKLKATKLPDQITAICCIVCSRVSERPLIAAEGEAEGEGIVICPHCLAEGDIDAKLERHAARWEVGRDGYAPSSGGSRCRPRRCSRSSPAQKTPSKQRSSG